MVSERRLLIVMVAIIVIGLVAVLWPVPTSLPSFSDTGCMTRLRAPDGSLNCP